MSCERIRERATTVPACVGAVSERLGRKQGGGVAATVSNACPQGVSCFESAIEGGGTAINVEHLGPITRFPNGRERNFGNFCPADGAESVTELAEPTKINPVSIDARLPSAVSGRQTAQTGSRAVSRPRGTIVSPYWLVHASGETV